MQLPQIVTSSTPVPLSPAYGFPLWPFWLFRLRLDGRSLRRERGARQLPVRPALLVLLVTLCWSSTALAEPVVSVYTNGKGGFTLMGNNLNRVTEAEVRIDYLSDDPAPPRVSGAGLGARGAMEVQADNPGSLTIRFKSDQPMSGYVLLATAQIRGAVTFLNAWLRNDKGTTETPSVLITNPTDEQLSEMAARRTAVKPPVPASPAGRAPAQAAPAVAAALPMPVAVQSPAPDSATRALTFSRRKSVLDLVRAHTGERTPASLARLFERSDDMFLQEPALLLSDGISALRLTVRVNGPSEHSQQFIISGGSCTGLKIGDDDGAWILEIVPAQGSLATSVTVLTGGEMIEYPLTVAPPWELFDKKGAGASEVEYVDTANWLVAGEHPAK